MENMKYDYLIVGAGLYGATFAHFATRQGKRCLVIDKRPHTGGNIYCSEVEGINVHQYGAHIFHTSDRKVWDFVNSIVPFNRYTNYPVAQAPDGRLYNLPFNMNTFYQMWSVKTPAEAQAKLDEQRHQAVERMQADGVSEPRNLEEQALLLIGRDIYEQLIKGYTEKQWGRPCRELPCSIIKRLPVRLTYDSNYFDALYQGIPFGGYTNLVEKMLLGVDVRLGVDYLERKAELDAMAGRIVYTGPIDAYFGYALGPLQYRSIRFETEAMDNPNYQGNAVVNYTGRDIPWTRIIEHKWFLFGRDELGRELPNTVISREYSHEWSPGEEPYYPIGDDTNMELYRRYAELAAGEKNVVFGGRLGSYRYYDMDQVIRAALDTAAKELEGDR